MKTVFIVLFFFISFPSYSQTLIPDVYFEQELIGLGLDSGTPDGVVQTSSIDTLINLQILNGNIASLSGIEDFTSLESFRCSCHSVNTADLSQNENLRSLNFSNTSALPSVLTSIFLPDSIDYLDLSNNKVIANLDLTSLPKLSTLKLKQNDLNSINISQNDELEHLDLASNSLNSIDLTQNPALEYLNVGYNDFLTINLAQNPQLSFLSCGSNYLTNLNLSVNTSLVNLICSNNSLSTLDVSNSADLESIHCVGNNLTFLDLAQNDSLRDVNCNNNSLTAISFGNMSELEYFRCESNELTAIDVSQCLNLYRLDCGSNQLSSLVLPPSSNLRYFDCSGNFLTELDLSILVDDWREVRCSDNLLNCLTIPPTSSPLIFSAVSNPNLTCIETSDQIWVMAFSTVQIIDPQSYFSQSCAGNCMTSIEELNGVEKKLVRIVDLLGREVEEERVNVMLIYVYDDGSIEKRFGWGY